MRYFLRLLLLITAVGLLHSCADKQELSHREKEQISLDAWAKEHLIDMGIHAERLENGMYVVYEGERSPDVFNVPTSGDWVKINYQGTDLDNHIFMTRDSLTAYTLGSLTAYAHYCPFKVQYSHVAQNMPEGLHYVFEKKLLREGETIKLYMPSRLFTKIGALTWSSGFHGDVAFPTGSPSIMTVELVEIIGEKPEEHGIKEVEDFAVNTLHLEARDTVVGNLFIAIDYDLPEEERVKIEKDDSLYISYKGFFLDGYLLDTNIGTVAKELVGKEIEIQRDTSDYVNPMKTTRAYLENNFIGAFKKVFESDTLSFNSSFKMVFSSQFGYQAVGNASSSTSSATHTHVQPYDPLYFEVTIGDKIITEEDEDEDKDKDKEKKGGIQLPLRSASGRNR